MPLRLKPSVKTQEHPYRKSEFFLQSAQHPRGNCHGWQFSRSAARMPHYGVPEIHQPLSADC